MCIRQSLCSAKASKKLEPPRVQGFSNIVSLFWTVAIPKLIHSNYITEKCIDIFLLAVDRLFRQSAASPLDLPFFIILIFLSFKYKRILFRTLNNCIFVNYDTLINNYISKVCTFFDYRVLKYYTTVKFNSFFYYNRP